jgi:MOSC domain-containing protein YiiM
MKLLSINVGLPKPVDFGTQTVTTGFYKAPVEGPVRMNRDNLEGDGQASLDVHGGADKAVYAYPHEHYEFWGRELSDAALPPGAFGENLTIEGLLEGDAHVGDELQIGDALVVITQPRLPCFKMGLKFGRPDIQKRFLESGRSGFYLRVVREGSIEAGMDFERTKSDPVGLSIAELLGLYAQKEICPAVLERVARVNALPEGWREVLRKRGG